MANWLGPRARLAARPRRRCLVFFARPKTRLETPMATTASLPSGQRVYAIGDIHGRLDLLQALSSKLRNDIHDAPSEGSIIVTLGDYIDRGPHSAGVIDWLLAGNMPARSSRCGAIMRRHCSTFSPTHPCWTIGAILAASRRSPPTGSTLETPCVAETTPPRKRDCARFCRRRIKHFLSGQDCHGVREIIFFVTPA